MSTTTLESTMPRIDTSVDHVPRTHESDPIADDEAPVQVMGMFWVARCNRHSVHYDCDTENEALGLAGDPSLFCADCAAEWVEWERAHPVPPDDLEADRHAERKAERRQLEAERTFDDDGIIR